MATRTYGGPTVESGTAGNVVTSNGTTPPTMTSRPQILNGTGAPASGTGTNGDMYLDTAASVLYGPKSGGAWPGTGTSLVGGGNASPVSGVIASIAATFSASGTTASWTVPSTVNGQTVTKLVVIDIVSRLLSGTPGTSATYGLTISSNSPYSSRALPTQGGGVDVGLMNLNVNNLSGTYKMANPGDTIVITSGGTFTASTTWAFDIFGYYVGLSPGTGLATNTSNAANTVPSRDSTSALRFAPPQSSFDGSAITTVSPGVADSNTTYYYNGTTGDCTVNLPAVPTGISLLYKFVHRGSGVAGGGRIILQCNSTGLIYVNGTNTSGITTLYCSTPGSSLTIVGIPGSNNWFVSDMSGSGWNDGSTLISVGGGAQAWINATGSMTLKGSEGNAMVCVTATTATINLPATSANCPVGTRYVICHYGTSGTLTVAANGNTIKWNNAGTATNGTTSAVTGGTSAAYNTLTIEKVYAGSFMITSMTGTWTVS